jgi:hypothetical protein
MQPMVGLIGLGPGLGLHNPFGRSANHLADPDDVPVRIIDIPARIREHLALPLHCVDQVSSDEMAHSHRSMAHLGIRIPDCICLHT